MRATLLKRLISRYIRKKATPAERNIVERLYDSFDLDADDAPWLDDMNARQDFENRLIAHAFPPERATPWYRGSWIRIAASVLLACSFSVFIYLAVYRPADSPKAEKTITREIVTGPGQVKRVLLPDSTEVCLNANSKLIIYTDFGQGKRETVLSGEAFFNVRPDKSRPFTVKAADVAVQVLGTAFNVSAYERLDVVRVAVSRGKVRFASSTGDTEDLAADDQVVYNRKTRTYARSRSKDNQPAWIEGRVILERASFAELAQAFYNVYGLQLESQDPEVLEGSYNLSISRGRRVSLALEQLCILNGKHYKEEGKRIIIY